MQDSGAMRQLAVGACASENKAKPGRGRWTATDARIALRLAMTPSWRLGPDGDATIEQVR